MKRSQQIKKIIKMMRKKILFFVSLFSLFGTILWAQTLPNYYQQQPYPNPYNPGAGLGDENYNDIQKLLQKREMYRQVFNVNSLSLGKDEAYFFLVGQFSLFLPYFLFSLPQPQIAIFNLASVMLMYP